MWQDKLLVHIHADELMSDLWLQGSGFLRTLRRCRSTQGVLRYSLTDACPIETPFDGILGYVR
jgi:hypothetical protein